MGIFSSKKKTYVTSVAYPLGQDGADRTDFMRYTVLNATLQNRPISESITKGYLGGQGMSMRNAFNYARDRYTHGVPTSAAKYLNSPDTSLITDLVQPKFPGAQIQFLTTVVGTADFEWWAEKHLTDQYGYDRVTGEFSRPPVGVEHDAAVAYDLEGSGLIRILLMNANGTTQVIDHRPVGYTPMATFVHCCYQARTQFTELDQVTTRAAAEGETDSIQNNVTTVVRAGETQERVERIEIDVLAGVATVHHSIVTTVTSRPQYLLYRLGAGEYPSLDAWLTEAPLESPYFPSVPIRLDNVDMVSGAKRDTELFKTSRRLLDKLGVDIKKIGEQVNENESIKDIDFAFVVFGVSLNTESQEGKRYLFRYFEYLRNISNGSTATKAAHEDWMAAHQAGTTTSAPKINEVEIYSQKARADNYDIRLQWDYIDTTIKQGLIFTGSKPGDCDVSMSGTRVEIHFGRLDQVNDSSKLYARRQIDEDTYEEMEISGLIYENFVYKGKSVIIPAYDAFHDPEEEGFIIPLNQQIVKNTPLKELTDLSYQCGHIVFNCYKVVKQKWYQRGIFQVIMVIIAIIIMVLVYIYAPAAAPALMTTLVKVFGTGMVAIIAAAAVTVIAGMILMKAIAGVSTKLFGEEWGALIAVVVSFLVMNWGNLANIASSAASGTITASQVMQASVFVLNAYGAWAEGQMSVTQKKALGLETDFDRQMKEIEELTKAHLDTSLDMIDIQGYTKATFLDLFEAPDTFLTRTLLTGSQVVEITNGMVENFAAIGLHLPNHG